MHLKNFFVVMGAILATGLALDMAGSGNLGSTLQKLAIKVTKGYGVSNS